MTESFFHISLRFSDMLDLDDKSRKYWHYFELDMDEI